MVVLFPLMSLSVSLADQIPDSRLTRFCASPLPLFFHHRPSRSFALVRTFTCQFLTCSPINNRHRCSWICTANSVASGINTGSFYAHHCRNRRTIPFDGSHLVGPRHGDAAFQANNRQGENKHFSHTDVLFLILSSRFFNDKQLSIWKVIMERRYLLRPNFPRHLEMNRTRERCFLAIDHQLVSKPQVAESSHHYRATQ